jgi:EmrB/QacA subfamily drug resistance transporter
MTLSNDVYSRRWLIASVVLIGTWVGTMGNSMIPVALPSIIKDYSIGKDEGVWIISIYTLLVGVLMPVFGWLGDRYGYRLLYSSTLIALAIFNGAAALAPNFGLLMTFRVLQGIFNAPTLVAVMAIISEVFPREERGAAMGFWATVNGAAHGFGPIISGFLVEHVGWQTIFWINGVTAVIGGLAVFYLVPTDHKDIKRPFDMIGAASFTIGMLIFMFVLSRGSTYGWTSPLILGLWTGLFGLLAVFITTERQVEKPFIELSLFNNRPYVMIVAINAAQFFCMMGLPVLLAFFFIDVQDRSSDISGLLIAPLASTLALSSPFGGRVADRVGFRNSMLIGMPLAALTAASMAFWDVPTPAGLIIITLIISGIGMGLTQSPAATGVTLVVPKEQLGVALGVFNMFRFVSGTLSVTTFGLILDQAEVKGLSELGAIHVGFYLVIAAACLAVLLAAIMPQHTATETRVTRPSRVIQERQL